MRVRVSETGKVGGVGCGCLSTILALNLTIGGVCFDYALASLFGKDVPWYADAIAGLFLGELTIPIAVGCWIAKLAGVETPFFP